MCCNRNIKYALGSRLLNVKYFRNVTYIEKSIHIVSIQLDKILPKRMYKCNVIQVNILANFFCGN